MLPLMYGCLCLSRSCLASIRGFAVQACVLCVSRSFNALFLRTEGVPVFYLPRRPITAAAM